MIGTNELLVILVLAVILFGANKLPELARNLGRSVSEFEKAKREAELELLELERKYKEGQYSKSERRVKLEKIAKDLGIDPTGKDDEELLDEINRALPKAEKAEP